MAAPCSTDSCEEMRSLTERPMASASDHPYIAVAAEFHATMTPAGSVAIIACPAASSS
jgi:hypothetical protein